MSLPPPAPPPITAVDRRSLFKLGALGLGALAVPVLGHGAGGFTHGVASGEPGPRQVLLWARYVGGGDTKLTWEVSETAGLRQARRIGRQRYRSARARLVRQGHRRRARPGQLVLLSLRRARRARPPRSAAPAPCRVGTTPKFRIAVFSCSNLGFGWFNAYAHAAEAGDFDLAVHLGDYLYEYKRGNYPIDQADACRAHARAARRDGHAGRLSRALRHLPRRPGPAAAAPAVPDDRGVGTITKAPTIQLERRRARTTSPNRRRLGRAQGRGEARLSRMAAGHGRRLGAAYDIGDLATLFRLETRLKAREPGRSTWSARCEGPPRPAQARRRSPRSATAPGAIRRTRCSAASRKHWLAARLSGFDSARGKTWQVLAQQVIMGGLAMNERVLDGLKPDAPG